MIFEKKIPPTWGGFVKKSQKYPKKNSRAFGARLLTVDLSLPMHMFPHIYIVFSLPTLPTFLLTFVRTYVPSYVFAYLTTDLHTCIYTYVPT